MLAPDTSSLKGGKLIRMSSESAEDGIEREPDTNATEACSTDWAKGTDIVDEGGDEEQSGDDTVVDYERRGEGVDLGGSARLRADRGWLMLNGGPLARHPSSDVDEWVWK